MRNGFIVFLNMIIYLVARVCGDDRDAILIMNDHMGWMVLRVLLG